MKLDKNINKIFEEIKKLNNNSSDIVTRIIKKGKIKVGYIYLESVSSDDKISDFLTKSIIKVESKIAFLTATSKNVQHMKNLFFILQADFH